MVTISDLTSIGFSDAQANHILANMKLKKMTLANAEIAEVKLMGYDTTQATAIVGNINGYSCNLAQAEQLAPGMPPKAILTNLGYGTTQIDMIQYYFTNNFAENLFQAEILTNIYFDITYTSNEVLKSFGFTADQIDNIHLYESAAETLVGAIDHVFTNSSLVTPTFILRALGYGDSYIPIIQLSEQNSGFASNHSYLDVAHTQKTIPNYAQFKTIVTMLLQIYGVYTPCYEIVVAYMSSHSCTLGDALVNA